VPGECSQRRRRQELPARTAQHPADTPTNGAMISGLWDRDLAV
jgi:hypothetical protein